MGICSYSLRHAIFVGLGALTLGLGLPQAAHAQQITRDAWRMYSLSSTVEVPNFVSPSAGHPESFTHAPQTPAANDPAWVPAPDSAIIDFRGHNGDEVSRLPDGSCRNAFDYRFFDTVLTVPEGATANTFTVAFIGLDDGSAVSIFNADYPDGTPERAEGFHSFVARTENADQASTMDMARFLRPGANRVVITQVDDCPPENRLKRADLVVNGVTVGAVPAIPADMSGGTGTGTGTGAGAAVAGILGGGPVDTAEPEAGLMAIEGSPSIVSAYGDVHFRTFSNIAFDIQTPGEYYFAGLGQGTDFVEGLQIRVSELEGQPGTAVVTAIAGKIGGAHAEVYLGATPAETDFYVNGEPVALEYTPGHTGAGYTDLNYGVIPSLSMAVATGLDDNGKHMAMIQTAAQWFLSSRNMETGDAEVRLNAQYDWATGLMGNMKTPNRDALTLRDGSTIALPASDAELQRYAESWRVAPADSYFVTRPQVLPPAAPAVTLADLSQAVLIEAAASCLREGVTEARLLRDCTLDVGKTGNPAFAASAADVQAALDATPNAPAVVVATGIDPMEEVGQDLVFAALMVLQEEDAARVAGADGAPQIAPEIPKVTSLQSCSVGNAACATATDQGFFLHAGEGDRGRISEYPVDAAKPLLQVEHVPLNDGATAVAFRDEAGRYLRVSPQDFTVSFTGTSAAEPEALFLSVPALDSPGAGFASFRALAFPERFLRHAGYVLFVDLRPTEGDQTLFNRDASWRIVTTEGN